MNAVVGERKVTLGGTEYLLRPSFQAFVEIEDLTKESLVSVINRFISSAPKFTDCVAILYACMRAADPKSRITYSQVGELVFAEGINALLAVCLELVATLYSGIQKKTGETAPPEGESETK